MPLKLVTPPATLPVTVTDVKEWSVIEHDLDNAMLLSLIASATGKAQDLTGRKLVTSTWDLILDEFPGRYGEIRLPAPLQSVTSVKYIDTSGVEQTLDAAVYTVDSVNEPCLIYPGYEKEWPETREVRSAVTIRFVCGWPMNATTTTQWDGPEEIKQYIKACVDFVYANRDGDPYLKFAGLLDNYILSWGV